ncbi:MAG: ATP-binding protein [Paracoccaceae bacterium]
MCTRRASLTKQGFSGSGNVCGDRFHRRFSAEPIAVRDALRGAVARFARGIPVETCGTLELALAEALNNIVEHGYAGANAGSIELRLGCDGSALRCEIADEGEPMPDLALPEGRMPALSGDPACLPEGGWGWALIRTLASDLTYRRERSFNHLSFRIPLSSK